MIGVDFLVDSNVLINLVNGKPEALALLKSVNATPNRCAYSSVTRMELLGWSGMTDVQEQFANRLLATMQHLPITHEIEDETIALRRRRKVKLPDAIIAATATSNGLRLLTLDQGLQSVITEQH
jgi:predicted nucleic acid-binding protein